MSSFLILCQIILHEPGVKLWFLRAKREETALKQQESVSMNA